MKKRQAPEVEQFTPRTGNFELVTLRMRWTAIVAIGVCFPFVTPRVYWLYGALALGVLFNLTRYSSTFMRNRWYASPAMILAADNMFLAMLLVLVGSVSTPFVGFACFAIISAAYRYRFKGTMAVAGLQLIWVWVVTSYKWLPPIHLSELRAGLLTTVILLALGMFIERLTRVERLKTDYFERMNREIEAGRKQLLTLVDSLNDGIFVVDNKGKIQEYNAAAADLSGATGDLSGKSFSDILALYPHVNMDAKPVHLLKDNQPQHRRDLSIKAKGGAVIDLDISVKPVHLEGGKTTDYIVVCKDITKERDLDEQRNEFISVASHELRTPIAIMEAALSSALLAKDRLDEQTLAVLEQAHTHSLYLSSIVKDLAMLAEANNDNIPVLFEKIDAPKLIHHMAVDFDAQAKQKGLELKVYADSDTPEVLSTENHIREILQNFITNAIKYTPKGQVVMRVKATKNGGVVFSVQDHGIGISPSDQKHLFTKFFRSEDFRTRQTGGSGLGLYLCSELARRLNGKVWCESELNKGSTFFLEVPPVSNLRRDQKEVVKAEVANLVEGI